MKKFTDWVKEAFDNQFDPEKKLPAGLNVNNVLGGYDPEKRLPSGLNTKNVLNDLIKQAMKLPEGPEKQKLLQQIKQIRGF